MGVENRSCKTKELLKTMDESQTDAYVSFNEVQKSYDGENLVVKDLNLGVQQGEFMTMLGPSGSGKTTCLMMLAGFETATSGEIMLDGTAINDVPPWKRDIGIVFQNYALFPHMTVRENLAYPLEVRKTPKSEIEDRVNMFNLVLHLLTQLLVERPEWLIH